MKRTALAIVLACAALGLLISLALASRPLPVEVHVAQSTIATDLERINDDFNTLVTALQSAWDQTQAPGEGAKALLTRVREAPSRLPKSLLEMHGSSSQEARVHNSYEGFTGTIAEASELADSLAKDQTDYATSVNFLRDSGARIIQQMRDSGLDRVAADTFQLVIGTLDFAGPKPSALGILATVIARSWDDDIFKIIPAAEVQRIEDERYRQLATVEPRGFADKPLMPEPAPEV